MRIRCAKMAERIAVPLRATTRRELINIVLDGGPNPHSEGEEWGKFRPLYNA